MKDEIKLMKFIFDFLNKLNEKQLDDLLHKKAKLNLDYPVDKNREEIDFKLKAEVDNVVLKLQNSNTREQALKLLNNEKNSKKILKEIAKKFNISINYRDSNQIVIDKIIENVIGSKLRFDALLNPDIKKEK